MKEESLFSRYLRTLQELDDPSKRKVFIVAVTAIMIVVVFLWAEYFNSIILVPLNGSDVSSTDAVFGATDTSTTPIFPTTPAVPTTTPTDTASPGTSNAKGSGGSMFSPIQNMMAGLANVFTGGKEYIPPSH